MEDVHFYSTPTGKFEECKKCATMMVDNWDPETYLWILEKADVPYVPEEWNACLAKYRDKPEAVTGTTIIGRYISKMKLSQWKKYHWADSDQINAELAAKKEAAEKAQKEAKVKKLQEQGYNEEEIAAVLTDEAAQFEERLAKEKEAMQDMREEVAEPAEEIDELENELTAEDRRYLKLKWGKYKPSEWVWLEQLYIDMMNSYDIQSAGHIDTLKLCCKASLKTHQLLNIGDIEGAQKSAKMYDTLMRSGKFTAQQNKDENGEFVDSVGELVTICEQQGFIPRYYIDQPKDQVDRVLADLEAYTHKLVTEEANLGNLIEASMKIIMEQEKNELDDSQDVTNGEDSIAEVERSIGLAIADAQAEQEELDVDDFQAYNDFLEAERLKQEEMN